MKTFVDGLKNKISGEIELLIALEEKEAKTGNGNSDGTSRPLLSQSRIRKFIPIPLLDSRSAAAKPKFF